MSKRIFKNTGLYNLEQEDPLIPSPVQTSPAPHLNQAVKIPPEGSWRNLRVETPEQEGE